MPSLHPGFEYDIFISYRHNDNRSGWVTEFVKSLQEELAATIKQPVSTYYDTNPHDGLLETHDVDKSLEKKLKCLIFLPILSQTYCDPKSFAWEHEFVAFNKLATADALGRDISLSNGNVASRILPIRIHELDEEDKATIETEIGAKVRAIDFIFKSSGVNRPLRSDEAHPNDNLNKTFYRDQVNKVANAIKEIISGIKNPRPFEPRDPVKSQPGPRKVTIPAKKFIWVVVFIFILAVGYTTSYFNRAESANIDKSVAVLAFADLSPGKDQEWFSDGLSEEILNSLANLKELKVMARTSSFYFKGKDVPLQEIVQKLGVAHIVEGSVRKFDNQLVITAQLIRAKDEVHLWSKTYNRTTADLLSVQMEIAEAIAKELLKELGPERRAVLKSTKPANPKAFEHFIRGRYLHRERFYTSYLIRDFEESERALFAAIQLDPAWAEAYGELADLYDTRTNIAAERLTYVHKRDSVIAIGYRLNPKSSTVLRALGFSWIKRPKPNLDSSFYYSRLYFKDNASDPMANEYITWFYKECGLLNLAEKYANAAIELAPINGEYLSNLVETQIELGKYDNAKQTVEKMLAWFPNDAKPHFYTAFVALVKHDTTTAWREIKITETINPDFPQLKRLKAMTLALEGKKKDALALAPKDFMVFSFLGMKAEFLQAVNSLHDRRKFDPLALRKDPTFDFVRDEPAYIEFEQRMMRDYEERLDKYGSLE